MLHLYKRLFPVFLFLFLPSALLLAQIPDPVTFTVTKAPTQIKTGDTFNVTIRAGIEGKWHLYSINLAEDAGPFPTKITAGEALEIASEIKESEPIIAFDPNFKAKVGWHSHKATFTIPLKLVETPTTKLSVDIFYQVCNDRVCMPPKTKTVVLPVKVEGVTLSAPVKATSTAIDLGTTGKKKDNTKPAQEIITDSSVAASSISGNGIFSFLWIAILAGFTALLTPCVFPMIPLTVSYFSKQDDAGRGIGQALGFGAGIVATFTLLGALLALFIGAAGALQFASNPWVNLFIGAVLVVFAMSLLGAFELRLPYKFTNFLNKKSNEGSGITGLIFMSLTISAVSFSCTAPFVGGVLAATVDGQWFYPIIGMIAFSAAFASPFVLFALFPGWLESLPKSGSWMNVVKVLLGFIELAAAFKFLSNADLVWGFFFISRPFVIAAWIAIFLLAALYVLGVFAMKHETKPDKIGTGRLVLSIPFLLFCFYLIPGLLGASLGIWDAWLPPKQPTDISVVSTIIMSNGLTENESDVWSDDYVASAEIAAEEMMPVFIDFTGYTCTNCRAMEANVFPLAEVQERFAKMKLVRLYTDGGEDAIANQQFQFKLTGRIALPTYAIVDPVSGKLLAKEYGYVDEEVFLDFLNEGLEKYSQINS